MVTQPRREKSSPESPWAVRILSLELDKYIERLGTVWVEGQVTQLTRRGASMAFMTLRDPAANMSIAVTCSAQVLDRCPVPLTEGTQVVVCGKVDYYPARGSLSLRVTDIRAVGVGELLARINRIRQLLDAEGLFDDRLKRPIPFLPQRIGLITARASAAERDVLKIAQDRWKHVQFETRHVVVQGPSAVPQIIEALRELDAHPHVDVIIMARGGGSVEDLLPFSDETLCREISAVTTPLVSAIGHEPDTPISDYVADVRAATPTDAAKRVVPDVAGELEWISYMRDRSDHALRQWVDRELRALHAVTTRPVISDPLRSITDREVEVQRLALSTTKDITQMLKRETAHVDHVAARLTSLGPAATLARGYAVVQTMGPGGLTHVMRSVKDAPVGTQVRIRVADGAVRAAVMNHEKGTHE